MKVKASLHLHSSEDKIDGDLVRYSLYELIDRLAALDFKVIASTGHESGICGRDHIEYARGKGILLIPGVEAEIDGHCHVLILNGGSDADALSTFEQLKSFKSAHPEVFIIAPHPNHHKESLTIKRLRQYRDLFDAVEHSWFYSPLINPNLKTERACAELSLPFIATADAHVMDYLDTDYALIEVEQPSAVEVFKAIRDGRFENVTKPKSLLQMISFATLMLSCDFTTFIKKQFHRYG